MRIYISLMRIRTRTHCVPWLQDLQKANTVLARELVMAHSRARESIGALQQQLADTTAHLSQERQNVVSQ
jgi:hypothetical protein